MGSGCEWEEEEEKGEGGRKRATYGYRWGSSEHEREASHAGSNVVGVSSLVASSICVTTRAGRCRLQNWKGRTEACNAWNM